jgi:hypothetical protein
MSRWLGFPAVVNEKAARTIGAGVAVLGATALVTSWWWLVVLMAVGFALRVAAGPRWSPLGRLATLLAPRLGAPRLVPGPPKRFAQTVGLLMSSAAALAALAFDAPVVGGALLGVLVAFATLEAAFGFCAGCRVFALLMRVGLVPEQTCAACADLTLRRAGASVSA